MDDAEIAAIESSLEQDERSMDLVTTAYHEAAHAAAAWRLGRGLHSVTIVPDKTSAGHVAHRRLLTRLDDAPSAEHAKAIQDHIVMAFAGPTSEALLTGRYDPETAHRDHLLAEELVSALRLDSAEQKQRCLDWLAVRTRDLVQAHWDLIQAVAAALVERGQLGSRTVREIIREAVEARERR